ncbi:MAG: DUF47 family protein [Bacteroidales bacterium]|jgi:uncharacterized protein|nr:DUF47 family protein [Bacteroidales bacterium]
MWLNKFIHVLTGSGKKFYPLFIEQSDIVEKSAALLVSILKEDSYEKKKEYAREVKALEKRGDVMETTIFEALSRTYSTPFDREDVQNLCSRIETFLDYIHDSAKKVVIYHPKYVDNTWTEIGELIYDDSKLLSGIIKDLSIVRSKSKDIMDKCVKIKDIEQEVDDQYECYMSNLFEVEKNGIELTKYKNIIQSLEDTTDKAKEIGDCIKMILVKEG